MTKLKNRETFTLKLQEIIWQRSSFGVFEIKAKLVLLRAKMLRRYCMYYARWFHSYIKQYILIINLT